MEKKNKKHGKNFVKAESNPRFKSNEPVIEKHNNLTEFFSIERDVDFDKESYIRVDVERCNDNIYINNESTSFIICNSNNRNVKITIGTKLLEDKYTIKKFKVVLNHIFVFLEYFVDSDKSIYKRAFNLDEIAYVDDQNIIFK
jgi:hypothetical protein